MRPMPGGYVEARGGLDKLKISGGTATDPANGVTSNLIYLGAHEHVTATGWVVTFDAAAAVNAQYSANRQFQSYFPYFATGAAGAGSAADATYFGADSPFSRLVIALNRAADWTSATTTWEFWDGSAWTALTMTENPDFEVVDSVGRIFASWAIPTTWAATGIGDNGSGRVYKFWVRVRLAAVSGLVTLPRNAHQPVEGDWAGQREYFIYVGDPGANAQSGGWLRFGVNGTAAEWYQIQTGLRSKRARFASYRGSVFMVNGRDQLRYDGTSTAMPPTGIVRNIGLTAPSGTVTVTAGATGPPSLGAGVWQYALAYGYGPQKNNGAIGTLSGTLYNFSAGLKASTYPITTIAGQGVTIDWSLLTVPADVDEILIFRSQDLTTVPAEKRDSMPMFLRIAIGRLAAGTMPTSTLDNGTGAFPTFPPVELRAFRGEVNVDPPEGSSYVLVHQNRLVLGNMNGDIYWSEPFIMNVFDRSEKFISLTKSHGGRLMGMVEFQDQIVAFTEEQTWGLTNIDLDIPQLYPIHSGVGCIAPDSIAEGDGLLFWAAQDGIYAWDGSPGPPTKISRSLTEAFGKLTFELHGGSRGIVHNRMYEIRLMSLSETVTGSHYRWDFETNEWSTVSHAGSLNLYPLATWHAPLGHVDAGARHPIYGQAHRPASDKALYMGELTTQDNAINYVCIADVHFTTPPAELFSPYRVLFYYDAPNGWATPVLSNQVTTGLGTDIPSGGIVTGTPDAGTDYNLIGGTFKESNRGSSDILVRFSATTQSGGTVNRQRLFGAVLQGNRRTIRRGSV